MKQLALFLLTAASAFAAIDGTLINRTTGKPAPNVSISLVKPDPQRGMRILGATTSDANGHFVFEKDEPGGGPQLLQANYKGVNYNKLLPPTIPTSNVEVDLFEPTTSPAVVQVAQQMLVFEPTISQLAVSETVVMQNQSNTTFNNPNTGSLRFFLPPAANGQVRVNAQGPQGMPLPRAAEKTSENNVFKVDFPIKPGETQFEINYVLPVGSPFTFRGRVVNIKGMTVGPLRLIVPSGVTLAGKDIQQVGTEPKTQATVYNVIAASDFSVDLSGTGSLHNDDNASPSDSDSPQITEGQPKIYDHLPLLIGAAFLVLALGLLVMYRSSPVASLYGKPPSQSNASSHRT